MTEEQFWTELAKHRGKFMEITFKETTQRIIRDAAGRCPIEAVAGRDAKDLLGASEALGWVGSELEARIMYAADGSLVCADFDADLEEWGKTTQKLRDTLGLDPEKREEW